MDKRFDKLSVVEIGLICAGLCLLESNLMIHSFEGVELNRGNLGKLKYELIDELKRRGEKTK